MDIQPNDWKWFGVAAHFVCGRWCRFHLCTQVGKYLVSTVGEYVHPRHSRGNERDEDKWIEENWPGEDIGADRKYETMVFVAGRPCGSGKCMCGLPVPEDWHELDMAGYNLAGDATAGHMAMCLKWASAEAQAQGRTPRSARRTMSRQIKADVDEARNSARKGTTK